MLLAIREGQLAKCSAFHTERGHAHHDHTNCSIAMQIAESDRIAGTGGLPLCRECANLQPRTGKPQAARPV
jgi:hypothetical protein